MATEIKSFDILIPREANFLNSRACSKCTDPCCKRLPGITLPRDWGDDMEEQLIKAFQSGKYAIDWYEDEPPLYFVRPAIKTAEGLYDPSWGGECIFLTTTGCELEPEKRPSGCILLEPRKEENGKCVAHDASKKESGLLWLPYENIIHKAALAVLGKEKWTDESGIISIEEGA